MSAKHMTFKIAKQGLKQGLGLIGLIALVFTLSTCKAPFGLGGSVDLEAPRSMSIEPGQGASRSGLIEISGMAEDEYGVDTVTVRILQKDSEGNWLPMEGKEYPTTVAGGKWTTGPGSVDTRVFPDGQYTISVIIKDARGNTIEDRVLVTFDNRAPTVLVEQPLDLDSEYNGIITVSGQAHDSLSSINHVIVRFYKEDGTLLTEIESATQAKWAVQFNANAHSLAKEDLYFVVEAIDQAGNLNRWQYTYEKLVLANSKNAVTASLLDLLDSQANPGDKIDGIVFDRSTLEGLRNYYNPEETDGGNPSILKIDPDSDMPRITFVTPLNTATYEENADRLSPGQKANGYISDDDLNVDPMEVAYRIVKLPDAIESASWKLIDHEDSFGKGTEQRWSFFLPYEIGVYAIQIRAEDNGGAVGISSSRFVIIDDGTPIVTISNKDEFNLYYNDDDEIYINATITHAGVGKNIKEVILSAGSNTATFTSDTAYISGIGSSNITITGYPQSLAGLSGGSTNITVKGKDNNDVIGQDQAVIFLDVDAPLLTITPPGDNLNGGVIFRGSVEDRATDAFITVIKSVEARIDEEPYETITGTYSWSWSYNTQIILDGDHTLQVRAYDIAGNMSEEHISFKVLQSTDKPVIGINNLENGATIANNFVLTGTVGDDDGIANAIDAIQVRVEKLTGSNPADDDDWTVAGDEWRNIEQKTGSALSTSWTYNLAGIASGSYRIRIRARDINSESGHFGSAALPQVNYWDQTDWVHFTVDTGIPVVAFTSHKSGDYVRGAFTLIGTIKEDQGIKNINLSINGSPRGTYSATGGPDIYNFSIPIDADWLSTDSGGSNSIQVDAVDLTDKPGTGTLQVNYDIDGPVVEIRSPSVSGTIVNGNITVSGTVSDNAIVSSVNYAIALTSAAAPEWPDGYTELAGQTYSFNIPIDTTKLQDLNDYNVYIIAADRAGNTNSPKVLSIKVNQDSDRPIIRLSNVRPSGNTTLLNTNIVSGIVLDDDGNIALENFKVSEDGVIWIDASSNPALSDSNRLYYDVDSRSFQYRAASGDGEKSLYFSIKDQDGKTFVSTLVENPGPEEVLAAPKIQYSSDIGDETSGVVRYKIDTNPPEIYQDIYFDANNPYDFTGADEPGDGTHLINNSLFGGPSTGSRARFALELRAQDATGIASISLSINGQTVSFEKVSGSIGDWEVFRSLASSPIDVSSWNTDSYSAVFTVKDVSGQTSTSTRQLVVDNTPPVIDITSHLMNEQVTGDLILRGSATDDGNAGLQSLEYQVGSDTVWKAVTGTLFSWNIPFTQAANNPITTVDTYANSEHATDIGEEIWRLPVKIRATDKAGNAGIVTHYFDVDPDGDKPIVSVDYPSDGSTLGGIIRIFGSAQDNERVDSVWMMIDTDNDGDFDQEDVNFLTDNGYTAVDLNKGFEVNGTASWNMSINTDKEFNPTVSEDTKIIKFRVRACDNYDTFGNWSDWRTITIDDKVPQIGSTSPLKLVQYDGSDNIIAERDYIANMYIRGEWYLTGSIWDESGIKDIDISGSAQGKLSTHENTWFIRDGEVVSTGKYNYTLRVPVGRSLDDTGAGLLTYNLYVEDDSTPSSTASQTILINYDNAAPVLNAAFSGGLPVSETNLVTQSNRNYSFGGDVVDSHSGFDKLVFFFVRRGSGSDTADRVYNPMLDINSRTNLSTLTWTPGDIPRLMISGLTRNGEDSLQHNDIIGKKDIRVGSLVRIAGVDRIIKSVDYDTGVVTFSPGVATSHNSAEFAYGLVVDNTTVEVGEWIGNVLNKIINDDGDGMVESVVREGGNYEWTASINSKNIPDGPIELHYVAFDKAGNSAAGSVETFVSNSRPRLAKVKIGTDLDGDGEFSSDEILEYYTSIKPEDAESLVNLESENFTIKGDMVVITEFVGGNGTLGYIYKTNGNPTDAWNLSNDFPDDIITGAVTSFTTITEKGTSIEHNHAIEISGSTLVSMDDLLKLFSFCIWDSTEGTTPGTDSQWARINAPLKVDVVDSIAPVTVVDPFFWNSATDNSLYGNSKMNGHIELEADLPSALFNQGTGLYDGDPKVSGQISIRGSAYDDTRLTALYVFLGGNTGTPSYYTFTGSGTNVSFDGRSYARVATFSSSTGNWESVTNHWDDEGWKFSITSNSLDQSGHFVTWQLDIDTYRTTGVAATDRLFRVVARDANPNASSEMAANPNGEVYERNIPNYQMDVVPYITGISTPKRTTSGLKDSNIRSSSGKYSVIAGNDSSFMTVSGFNLNPNYVRIVNEATVGTRIATGAGTAIAYSGATAPYTSFSLSNNSGISGYLEVFTSGIRALNNVNTNDASGQNDGSNALDIYNREADPNIRKNLLLDDDRYLRFFSMQNTTIKNGYYPTMIMDGDRPVFGLINPAGSGGSYYGNAYQPQRIRFNTNGTTNSTEVLVGALAFEQMAMARDAAGRYHHFTHCNYSGDPLNFIYDSYSPLHNNRAWGGNTEYTTSPSNRSFATGNNAIALETNTLGGAELDRYEYPKMIVNGNSVNSYASIYLSYYDDYYGRLIFRNFQIGTQETGNRTTALYNGSGYAQYTNITENTSQSTSWSTGRLTVADNASKYFDMAVTSDNRVIFVYYDEAQSRLVMTYSGTGIIGRNPNTNITWTTSALLFPEYVGQYVSMTVDSNNGIHIAAFDASDADLKYIYLSAHNATSYSSHTVDAAFSVGMWTKIALHNNTPYIAYYNSSEAGQRDSIKLAYANTASGSVQAGVDGNGFVTGHWEFMTVPSISPAQGGSPRFKQVNLDFDSSGRPVIGYLGTNIEFGTWLIE